jgi:uncharacterized protein YgiM (DUF1202 family)
MKKALTYALALALALSLTACGQPKTEQPTDPAPSTSAPEPIAAPEPIKDTTPEPEPEQTPAAPVETEDTQPPEETESEVEQVQLFTDCNETVYATGTVNIRASYTANSKKLGSLNKGDSVTRTGTAIAGTEAEGWSRVELSDGTVAYISSKYLSTTKPVVQQQQQQQTSKPSGGNTTQQQQQQQTQQPSEPQGGGEDSAADIEARKQAFLNGMNQMFEDHGLTTEGEDHDWTDEEVEALQKALGQ